MWQYKMPWAGKTTTYMSSRYVGREGAKWRSSASQWKPILSLITRSSRAGKKKIVDYFDYGSLPRLYTYDLGDNWVHAVVFEGTTLVRGPDGSMNIRRAPQSVSVQELAGVLKRKGQTPVDLNAARAEALYHSGGLGFAGFLNTSSWRREPDRLSVSCVSIVAYESRFSIIRVQCGSADHITSLR